MKSINRPPTGNDRIWHGALANAISQGSIIGTQLATIPIALTFWQKDYYGTWILISSIPSYLNMADGGFANAAMNAAVAESARGNLKKQNGYLSDGIRVVSAVAVLTMILAGIILSLIHIFSTYEKKILLSIFILIAGVCLNLYTPILDGVYRCKNQFAKGTIKISLIRIFEWLGLIASLSLGGGHLEAATAMLVSRLAATLLLAVDARILNLSSSGNPLSTAFSALAKPAVGFLSLSLTYAAILQGFAICVGSFFGSAALADFNITRTYARASLQATNMIGRAFWPRFTKARATDSAEALRILFKKASRINTAIVLATFAISVSIYPAVLRTWTHNTVTPNYQLFIPLLIASSLAALTLTPNIFLQATNCHGRIARYMLLLSLTALAVSTAFAEWLGLYFVISCYLLYELISLALHIELARENLK